MWAYSLCHGESYIIDICGNPKISAALLNRDHVIDDGSAWQRSRDVDLDTICPKEPMLLALSLSLYVCLSPSRLPSLYIYIYMHMCVFMYMSLKVYQDIALSIYG